jgi:Tfp pilus assembly protein PilO
VTLIFEIAAGIVLGVVFLYSALFVIVWIGSWSDTTKLVAIIIVVALIAIGYNAVFPDKKASSHVTSADLKNTPLETRAHFAARYKQANPETAKVPDEELVKRVLQDYPEWCSKVEGGCP